MSVTAEILRICLEAIVWLALVLGGLTLFEMLIERRGEK